MYFVNGSQGLIYVMGENSTLRAFQYSGTTITTPAIAESSPITATSGNTAASFALARYLSTGKLDTTFGTGGLVTTSFGSTTTAAISALVIQTDGKIVAAGSDSAGNLVVARYLGQ